MPNPADWMNPADDMILNYLKEHEHARPTDIASGIDYTRKYIGRRCRKLAYAGLLDNIGNVGLYELTDTGRAYLNGEQDASELPHPEKA